MAKITFRESKFMIAIPNSLTLVSPCSDNHTYTMQLTNETSMPLAWIEAEGDYEDYEEVTTCSLIMIIIIIMISDVTFRRITVLGTSVTTITGRRGCP